MRGKWGRAAMLLGIVGAVLICTASAVTALTYVGIRGQRYSPFNHFVSELGEVGVSPWAHVFNLALVVGGACIAVCLAGIACTLPRRVRLAFGAAGLMAGLSGTLAGAFPMNNFSAHVLAAVTFFNMGWIAVALFSAYVYFSRDCPHPRWLAYAGLPCVVAFLVFLVQVPNVPLERLAVPSVGRPDFWPFTLAEWLVIACVLLWVVLVALGLRRGQAD